MFNRYIYEKYQKQFHQQLNAKRVQTVSLQLQNKMVSNYKARVCNFLLSMAVAPNQICHTSSMNKVPKFKTHAQLEKNQQSPFYHSHSNHKSNKGASTLHSSNQQVQTGIRHYGNILRMKPKPISQSSQKLFRVKTEGAKITNGIEWALKKPNHSLPKLTSYCRQQSHKRKPKTQFKAVEEFGNKLKTMTQDKESRMALINRFQGIYGMKDMDIYKQTLCILGKCRQKKRRANTQEILAIPDESQEDSLQFDI